MVSHLARMWSPDVWRQCGIWHQPAGVTVTAVLPRVLREGGRMRSRKSKIRIFVKTSKRQQG